MTNLLIFNHIIISSFFCQRAATAATLRVFRSDQAKASFYFQHLGLTGFLTAIDRYFVFDEACVMAFVKITHMSLRRQSWCAFLIRLGLLGAGCP